MRRLLLTAFAVALPLALAGPAPGDGPDPKGTIATAIQDHGRKDIQEGKLHSDKGTYLLAKVERKGTAPMSTDEVKQEIFLSDYKEVQGVKRPTKTVMNNDGKKFMESTVTEQKFLEKLDDKDF